MYCNTTPLINRYDERIDRVETRITARLRDQLGLAKNANEMFRIFSRFNALFVRPHIRGAIREYQTQLMQRVKDDIEVLHDKFKVRNTYLALTRMQIENKRDQTIFTNISFLFIEGRFVVFEEHSGNKARKPIFLPPDFSDFDV